LNKKKIVKIRFQALIVGALCQFTNTCTYHMEKVSGTAIIMAAGAIGPE
jgi:hypothetical protein